MKADATLALQSSIDPSSRGSSLGYPGTLFCGTLSCRGPVTFQQQQIELCLLV